VSNAIEEKWAQVSKGLGNVSEKTKLFAKEVCVAAWLNGHDVYHVWGNGSKPDHVYNRQGRPVVDFMVHNEAAGDFVRDYVWEHRARLGLKHVIWEQHITSTVVQPGVRRKMEDRGDRTANHYDHDHVELFAEPAYTPPPDFGTPTGGGSTPPSDGVLKRGSKGDEVLKLQTFFHNNFPGYARWSPVRRGAPIDRDGDFGPQTEAWVKLFQERTRLAADGEVGPNTRAQLKAHGYK
jgi:hypothetical protein